MAKKNSFKIKSGQFIGSNYRRGGLLHDKHRNTYKVLVSYRNNHSGLVVDSRGNLKGIERNKHHNYGQDYRKIKPTKTQTAQKRAIMRSLRKKGKIR